VTITANGKPVEVSGEVSVTRMLEELKISDPLYVTVQLNEELVPRSDFDTVMVQAGAVVEFFYIYGGRHRGGWDRAGPMLILPPEHREAMILHGRQGLPNESCGLIAGEVRGEEKTVRAVYGLTNTDRSAEHFSMDPTEQFRVIKDIRNRGWVLLGNFHSHPATPARPSAEDIRLAFDPSLCYVIISFQRDPPELKSFLIRQGQAEEEAISVPAAPEV
jgi:thiamine biosynthesis protein ThiS